MKDRKPWVGGNWKCNGTKASIEQLSQAFNKAEVDCNKLDVVICPPAVYIPLTRELLKSEFQVASQNVSKTGNGAFTGELSADMLKDVGLTWTLVGHSERRNLYGECDATVAAKVDVCQKSGLSAVVCIGELLEHRKSGQTHGVLRQQMEAFIPKVTDWSRIVIAYEPVWAIGTGVVATPEQAQEAHQMLRSLLSEKVGADVARSTRIVYGGSVTKDCEPLIDLPDVDGFLVGGASLKPDFVEIIRIVSNATL